MNDKAYLSYAGLDLRKRVQVAMRLALESERNRDYARLAIDLLINGFWSASQRVLLDLLDAIKENFLQFPKLYR